MKATEIIEMSFSETQIVVIKSIVRFGLWGDCSHEMANGETKEAWGYFTSGVKVGGYTSRQISGIISGIVKTIRENKFDFMNHAADYWETGSTDEGVLFFSNEVMEEIEKWARK